MTSAPSNENASRRSPAAPTAGHQLLGAVLLLTVAAGAVLVLMDLVVWLIAGIREITR